MISKCGRDIMRKLRVFICVLMFARASVPAFAMQCPGNPDALGTSCVLAISSDKFSHIGSMQYKQTLPLNYDEVVITFDDGPFRPTPTSFSRSSHRNA